MTSKQLSTDLPTLIVDRIWCVQAHDNGKKDILRPVQPAMIQGYRPVSDLSETVSGAKAQLSKMTSTPWLPDSTACPYGLNGDKPATQAVGIDMDAWPGISAAKWRSHRKRNSGRSNQGPTIRQEAAATTAELPIAAIAQRRTPLLQHPKPGHQNRQTQQ